MMPFFSPLFFYPEECGKYEKFFFSREDPSHPPFCPLSFLFFFFFPKEERFFFFFFFREEFGVWEALSLVWRGDLFFSSKRPFSFFLFPFFYGGQAYWSHFQPGFPPFPLKRQINSVPGQSMGSFPFLSSSFFRFPHGNVSRPLFFPRIHICRARPLVFFFPSPFRTKDSARSPLLSLFPGKTMGPIFFFLLTKENNTGRLLRSVFATIAKVPPFPPLGNMIFSPPYPSGTGNVILQGEPRPPFFRTGKEKLTFPPFFFFFARNQPTIPPFPSPAAATAYVAANPPFPFFFSFPKSSRRMINGETLFPSPPFVEENDTLLFEVSNSRKDHLFFLFCIFLFLVRRTARDFFLCGRKPARQRRPLPGQESDFWIFFFLDFDSYVYVEHPPGAGIPRRTSPFQHVGRVLRFSPSPFLLWR